MNRSIAACDGSVNLPFPGRRARIASRIFKGFMFVVLSFMSIALGIPVHAASPTASVNKPSPAQPSIIGAQDPQLVGAEPLTDLSMPKTVISGIEKLIGAGGVVQSSPQNLTIYNLALRMRLLGGLMPHDEVLSSTGKRLSSYASWKVEVFEGGLWIPLLTLGNNFTILGTNTTGTIVIRDMQLGTASFAANLRIVYHATPAGPLKWDLIFTPNSFGRYRLVFAWQDIQKTYQSTRPKQFLASYDEANYTLSWADITSRYNVTTSPGTKSFNLYVDLGSVTGGSHIVVDPSVVSSSSSSLASSESFQRKVFYEPKGGYYFVFYFDGLCMTYRTSRDGVTWGPSQGNTLPGLIGCPAGGVNPPSVYLWSVSNYGQSVVLASSDSVWTTMSISPGQTLTRTVYYSNGTISGPGISWSTVKVGDTYNFTCNNQSSACTGTIGIRYISPLVNSGGSFAFSYNWFVRVDYSDSCDLYTYSASVVVLKYKQARYVLPDYRDGCGWFDTQNDRSIVLPPDSYDRVRIIYQTHSVGVELHSAYLSGNGGQGQVEIIDSSLPDGSNFSAVSDTSGGAHVVYTGSDGLLRYKYHAQSDLVWGSASLDILSGQASSPTMTVDYSTNDLYIFAIRGSSIVMRSRALSQSWSDRLVVSPVNGRTSPQSLSSNFASISNSNQSRISLVWTEGSGNGPFNVTYAGIPISTVWSPFSSPSSPWDGNGIVPFGEYFANLGDYVSPSTGMLTLRQTDLSVPGRGVNLDIARVYSEPSSFTNGNPYGYESSYAYWDNSFSSGWTAQTVGSGFTLNSEGTDGDVLSISGTLSGVQMDNYRVWTSPGLSIDTTAYPYLVARWKTSTSASSCYGLGVGVVVNFSDGTSQTPQPTDCSAFSTSWTTKVYSLNPGKKATSLSLFANDNPDGASGTYSVYYDYVGVMKASIGKSWQLNFPWLTTLYVHLWDGQGYRIPSSFWNGGPSTFENHQGEHFILSTNSTGVYLVTKTALAYRFDLTTKNLQKIVDSTGNNITFGYDSSNRLSSITDSVGRLFTVNYNSAYPMLIQSINQTLSGVTVRAVGYVYDSKLDLISVVDPLRRTTGYSYQSTADPSTKPWILTRITYPTGWYTNYTYVRTQLGTEAWQYTYQVNNQCVGSGPQCGQTASSTVREFTYSYTRGPGDSVSNSTVTTYNSTQLVSFTTYSFSFAGMVRNVSDANHHFLRGVQQLYGVQGEIPKEIVLVTNGDSSNAKIGKYTNYYGYDLWGNLVYSRKAINSTAYHDSYNAYYNGRLPPGFYAFQDTFSQNAGRQPDNAWQTLNGIWYVNGAAYLGSWAGGSDDSTLAWFNIGKGSDYSLQSTVWTTGGPHPLALPRLGIFTHYSGSGTAKWALVLHYSVSAASYALELCDEGGVGCLGDNGQPGARMLCSAPSPSLTYAFNMTIYQDLSATGWVSAQGVYCNVSGQFSSTSPSATSTGFGLYPGSYTAFFKNVLVAPASKTSSPYFTNSFMTNGGLSSSIHGALAGSAETQNSQGAARTETYYSYYPWGGLNVEKKRYDASGGTTWPTSSRTYDTHGNVLSLTDPRGNFTTFGYSASYQCAFLTSQTHTLVPGGTVITALNGYNFTMGTRLWSYDPLGHNTTYTYDILGRLLATSYPNSLGAITNTYNDQINYVDIVNSNNWKTRQAYDGLGRLVRTEKFSGATSYSNVSVSYDWGGRPQTQVDAMGRIVRYRYDALGRTVQITKPDGNYTQTVYDDFDSWSRLVDESGTSKCSISDRLSRLVSVVQKASTDCKTGVVTNYYYDEVNNLMKVIDSNLQTTLDTYDSWNQLVSTLFADGTSDAYSYDNNGNVVKRVDRAVKTTLYAYDSLNRLTTVTYCSTPWWFSEAYTYDSDSNVVQFQNWNSSISYAFDARNRILGETYSINNGGSVPNLQCFSSGGGGGGSVAEGTLIRMADGSEKPVQDIQAGDRMLGYDTTSEQLTTSTVELVYTVETNNMLIINTREGAPFRTDANPAQTLWVKRSSSIGWLPVTIIRPGDFLFSGDGSWVEVTGITSVPKGQHTMYDLIATAPYFANGYLDPQQKGPSRNPSGSPNSPSSSYTVSYTYTGDALTRITYPDGSQVNYGQDGLGRTSSAFDLFAGLATTFSYFPDDTVKGVQYSNGEQANYTYSKLSLPSELRLTQGQTSLLNLNYTYTKTGTIASVIGNSTDLSRQMITVNEQYSYDPMQRLTNSSIQTATARTNLWYEYDNLGNRNRQSQNRAITTYSYNLGNNELSSTITNGASTNYLYDFTGGLSSQSSGSSTTVYTFDIPGRLLKVVSGGVTQGAYGYDARGRRVVAMEGSTTTFYAYIGTETLYEKTGSTSTDYVYAAGMRIAKITGSIVANYHTDHLGSTRLVTDNSLVDHVLFSDGYQPFGLDNAASGSETYKFTGKPVSQTTGLYYYGARWYDSSVGRFISQDPYAGHLSNPQSLNPYSYAENTPTTYTDPTGQFVIEALIGAGVGALVGYVGCGIISGGWTSSSCGEAAAIGAGIGGLAGMTDGLSLLGSPGLCEEDPAACTPSEPTTSIGPCECPSSTPPPVPSSTTEPIPPPGPAPVTTTITSSIDPSPTRDAVSTASFFSRVEVDAGAINSNTLVALDNGFPVPSSSVDKLVQEWVGADAVSAPSGTGTRFFNSPSPGILQQARVDYGQIDQQQDVYRVVLETYLKGKLLFKVHLPIIG